MLHACTPPPLEPVKEEEIEGYNSEDDPVLKGVMAYSIETVVQDEEACW